MPDPKKQRRNPMMGNAPARRYDPRGSAAGPGSLNGVPAFARQIVDWSKVKERPAPPDGDEIASVDSDQPTTIRVSHPDAFTPALRGHESTHVAQMERTDGVWPGLDIQSDNTIAPKDYDYGGMPGLRAARAAGKTMANFNREQQASMVEDYIRQSRIFENLAKKGKLEPGDLKEYQKIQDTYHPFVKQLLPQPEGDEINTHPDAPGLPSADTPGLGMMKPDPLLGGAPIATEHPHKAAQQNPLSYDVGPLAGTRISGLLERGNIDVNHRPLIHNADGTHSTIDSMTVPIGKDGKSRQWGSPDIAGYALVPSIADGRFLTPDGKIPDAKNKDAQQQLEDAATAYYNKTGQHLGIFKTDKDADKYANQTHAFVPDGTSRKVYHPSYEGESNIPEEPQQKVTPEPDWDDNDYKAHGMTPPAKGKKVADTNTAPDGRSAHDRLHEIASRALSSLPEQLQRHLTSDNVNFGHGDLEDTYNTGRPDYAGVVKGDPHTIMFDSRTPLDDHTVQQLVAHEGMHIIQHNLPPEIAAKIPADDPKDPYNYGGAAGLMHLRQQGGNILSLPREKQSAVIQYYVSQRPHVTGQAAADLDHAYKPFLDDLDHLPQSQIQPTAPSDNSGTIDTTPRAPTPPPDAYSTGQ
jgi:hypothetical protein